MTTTILAIAALLAAFAVAASFYPGRTIQDGKQIDSLPGIQAETDREASELRAAVAFSAKADTQNLGNPS